MKAIYCEQFMNSVEYIGVACYTYIEPVKRRRARSRWRIRKDRLESVFKYPAGVGSTGGIFLCIFVRCLGGAGISL